MFKCFSTWKGWVFLGIAVLVAGYLVIEHQQHLAVVLPFLLLLGCPLMHLFMHGKHGTHAHQHERANDRADQDQK